MALAHKLSHVPRTKDIHINDDSTFESMLLSEPTFMGLRKAGFYKPSPVQHKAIPLGKCGFDLLLEAKSGTGKTAVFTIIALEMLDLNKFTQALILAPTREIAAQIADVITQIGYYYEGLKVEVVIGGLSTQEDIKKFENKTVHIVVGSPGRVKHLIQNGHIDVSSIRLFVIDEADKLMEESFQKDINYIYARLPERKQMLASSATYSKSLRGFLSNYMKNPCHINPDSTSVLLGISQKITIVNKSLNITKQTQFRYKELIKIFRSIQFKQCLIFCKYQARVKEVSHLLKKDKWPVETLHGGQEQTDRLNALKTLQNFECRILVSTDLAARGIDASNVDLVINFEPPGDWTTYLHRIGRAGRYGSYGLAISIIAEGDELKTFERLIKNIMTEVKIVDLWTNNLFNFDEERHNEYDNASASSPDVSQAISIGSSRKEDDAKDDIEKNESTSGTIYENGKSDLNLNTSIKENGAQDVQTFDILLESNSLAHNETSQTFDQLFQSYTDFNDPVEDKTSDSLLNPPLESSKDNKSISNKKTHELNHENSCDTDKTYKYKNDDINDELLDKDQVNVKSKPKSKPKKKGIWLRPYHKEYYDEAFIDKISCSKDNNPETEKNKMLLLKERNQDDDISKEAVNNDCVSFMGEKSAQYEQYRESDEQYGDYYYENGYYYDEDGYCYNEDGYCYNEHGYYHDDNGDYNGDYYDDQCENYDQNSTFHNTNAHDYVDKNEENGMKYTKNTSSNARKSSKDHKRIMKNRNHGSNGFTSEDDFSTRNHGEITLGHIDVLKQNTIAYTKSDRVNKKQNSSIDNSDYNIWRHQLALKTFQIQYASYISEMSKLNF